MCYKITSLLGRLSTFRYKPINLMLKDRNIQAESGSRSATTEWGNMEGKYVAYSLQPESRLPNSV